MVRRILVPLDGSAESEAVLTPVAELARAEGAAVRLLHVAAPVEARVVDGRVVSYADQEAGRVAHQVVQYLTSAATALAGLDVDMRVRFGAPAEQILEESEAQGIELVAMATHRRAGLRRIIEGSVAERVERASKVPVLLVTYGESRSPSGQEGPTLVGPAGHGAGSGGSRVRARDGAPSLLVRVG